MGNKSRKILAKDLKVGDKVISFHKPGSEKTKTIVCNKVLYLNESLIEVSFIDSVSGEKIFEGLYERDLELSVF